MNLKKLSWLGLILLWLNLFVPVGANAATTAALPTWRDPSISLADGEGPLGLYTPNKVCLDPTRPDLVVISVKVGNQPGTYAYNPVSGQKTKISSHIAGQCYKDQYYELNANNTALRFDMGHPDGQILEHYPTYTALDGSNVAYSVEQAKDNYSLWFTADGGTNWQYRYQFPAATSFSLVIDSQNAHDLYALYTTANHDATGDFTEYTILFSSDTGSTWHPRTTGKLYYGDSTSGGTASPATAIIKPLDGPNVPDGTLLLETQATTPNYVTTVHLSISTDSALSFTEARHNADQYGESIQLLQTPNGIVRLLNDFNTTKEGYILSRTKDGKTWQPLSLPSLSSSSSPYAILSQDVTAGNNLFLSAGGHFWYSPDGGASWQEVAQPRPDATETQKVLKVLSYQPLTLWAAEGPIKPSPTIEQLPYIFLTLDGPSLVKPVAVATTNDNLYFPQTGHNLSGVFRKYWEAHGGLAQFGLPWTEVFPEVSATDGMPYLVQYFERNRFEYHPEKAGTDYEVLLGLLGSQLTVSRKADPAFQPVTDPKQAGVNFYPETHHTLSGTFKTYWEAHGGLAIYGYPISEPFQEVNPDDGQTYTVQYFERNRFEYHPANKGTPYEVLLGLLGNSLLRDKGWL